MRTVLLVEDDAAIAQPLARALQRQGLAVRWEETGKGALVAAREGTDLIVLDLGLPDLDGVEVCRQSRGEGLTMPVLVLTARAEEVDTVVGLDAGADDYVTKPFRVAELLARVRALLRRGDAGGEESVVTVGGLRLDEPARRVWLAVEPGRDAVELTLSVKEFDLLATLMRSAGSVVSRERLMEEVWGHDSGHAGSSTKTLDMHVSWLRRKLGDDISHPRWITTVRGRGFRFERD